MSNKKYIAELLGTFIFCLGINMSTNYTPSKEDEDYINKQIPNLFGIIASLFCAITITRNVSGGHLNGAVSLAFAIDELRVNKLLEISDNNSILVFIKYYVFQCIGAFIACTLSFFFYHGHILTFSDEKYSLFGIIISEGIATFIFVFNILTQAEHRFSKNNSISSLLIVLGLYAAVSITSICSSGCINPSLALGHFIARFMFNEATPFEFYQTILYVAGEAAGAFVAGVLYNKYFRGEVDVKQDAKEALRPEDDH